VIRADVGAFVPLTVCAGKWRQSMRDSHVSQMCRRAARTYITKGFVI
jgi:hypothetical protein